MRTIYPPQQTKNLHIAFVIFSVMLVVGCSGYQPVSYYGDGIYGEAPKPQPRQEVAVPQQAPQQQSGTYYKNYFAVKASQGVSNDYIFTNPEQYQTPTPEQTSAGNYQAHGSWGDQAERINVNIIYNRPVGWNWGWGWYDAPFSYGRSAFWGYNYHPWYFTFDHFHNPYYNPYRWGYRYPYWNRWNRWDRWGYYPPPVTPYWDRYYNRRVYNNGPIYSRLNGGRGDSRFSRTSTRNSNRHGNSVDRTQTNSNSGSLRNKMRRRSQSNSDYSTNSNRARQETTTTRRSRSNTNDNSYSRTNNSRNSYNSTRNNSSNYERTRSSSNQSFSRTSAGSRSSSGGSSRSSSSRRR
jgi:hypothetical protein